MAKKDIKQLNYTVEEINAGLQTALEHKDIALQYSENNTMVQLVCGTGENQKVLSSVQNLGSEVGGLTLRYIDEKTLRIYNTNGSTNKEDWTPVGDEILIISADPDAISYKFEFEYVSSREPQIFVKESVDANPDKEDWQIQYKIKQLDNKDNIIYDPIEVKWTIQQGGNTREFTETIKYSVNSADKVYSFNWIDKIRNDTNFYIAGDYFVKARFIGTDGVYTNRNWSFSLTSLKFSSTFEESIIYKDQTITIPYTVKGQMSKAVVGKLINKKNKEVIELGTETHTSNTNEQSGTFTVKNLEHGTYGIRLDCIGTIGTTEIKTPTIYKEFIFIEDGNMTPLIRWSYLEEKPLQQFVRTAFSYGIYNPGNPLSNIEIELFSENNNTTQTRTVSPNNTTHTWYYYPTTNSNGEEQEFSIKIKESELKVSKNIVVNSFEGAENIEEITGAVFDFNPIGRTNFDTNRNEYIFKDKNYLSVSEDFDWANGGWVQENIGTIEKPQIVDAFLIKAGSRMTLDYELFKTDIRNTGKNIKFIFKTVNCQNMEAPVMTCKGENSTGLIINSQNAKIYYRQNGQKPAIDLPYVEEEVVELEYNIEAENIQNSEQVYVSRGRKPLLVTYLSSDPSQAVICEPTSSTTQIGQGQWTQDSPEKMQFGSDYCDVYLYRVKVYERELSDENIMQNYYADAFDGPMGYQRYKDNDILTNGEIDIEKLKQKYPNLRILKIDCKDVWTKGKKDFKEVYVEHHYPGGRLKDNWKANAAVAIQGTSSVEYLTSAGNFDIDLSWATMGNVEKDDYLLPTRPIGMKYLVDGVYYSKEELLNPSNTDLASKISPEEVAELLETEYAMTDESIPIDYINVKVNIASSENANNARIAEWYNKYNAYKRRVIAHNSKVRDTMEFHPCVVFLKENAGLDNREFDNDGNYHFYACGDFGNSKKNNHVFGMGEEAQYIVDELIANGAIQENERENKIKEYQDKECIVEVSNNINDICRFKTAIFEDYQSSYDSEKQKVVVTDVWDGDAVEFRYKSDKKKAKEETLKLWRWLYSVDATNPGGNEIFISNVTKTILDNSINYSFDTPIPHTEDFTIKTITPNFMFNKTIIVSDKETTQTYSKCSVSKFVTEILGGKEEDYVQIAENIDGNYKIDITIPKEYLTYAEKDNWSPKFFVTFTSKNMLNWNQDNTFEITNVLDTADNRNAKFKEEYKNYFEEKSLLYFYLFTERFTMIDNRAKNTFIHFDGLKWNYCFDYDNDTALGCNNRGYLTMDYGVEDIDNADGYPLSTHGGDPAFNANDSVVWVSVRNNLLSELKRAYNTSALAWSASTMNQDFEDYQGYKCNWLQMIDMRRKYLRPFTDGHGPSTKAKTYEEKYLPMLQGRKTLQRKRYQKYQEIYFESKYTSSTAGNEFTFRAAYKDIGPIIIPYIKCYPSIRWDDTGSFNERTWGGEPYATPMRENENDLNFVIYPANYISAVKNLNNVGLKSASVSSGVKLIDVDLSDNPNLPSGDNSTLELSGTQTLLSNVNLRNTGAAIVPSLSELTSIKTLNTEDTQVTVISFADGGLIEEARLGALTEELSTVNNTNLHTITIQQTEGKYNLKKIILNNPSIYVNWIEFVDIEKCPLLKDLTILNIDYIKNNCWSFTNNSWIEKLYNKENVTLSGHIYIDQIREHDYNKYLEKWPSLTITYSGKFMPTYSVSYYNNYDPVNKEYLDFLFEEFYDKDSVAVKPSIIPTKPSDEHYVYTFKNWSVEEPGQPGFIAFNADTSTYAIYEKTDRKYKVTWYKDSTNKEVLDTKYYSYGEEAIYEDVDGKLGPRHVVEGFNEYYNLFKGWDQSTSYITGDIEVYGQWEKGDCSSITTVINNETEFVDGFDTKDLNAAQIYTLKMKNQLRSCFGARDEVGAVKPNFDRIKIPFGDRLNYNNLNSKRVPLKYIESGIEKELTFPCTFNKDKIIKTTNPLFNDISRGWTLFVDVQFVDINDMNRCLVSCFDEENSAGFKVCNSDDNYPMIQYNTAESKNGSSATNVTNRNTSGSFMREVFVLVHKPGETSIHTYSGMLDQLKPAYKELKCSNNTYIHNNVLQFGGYYDISEYPTHLAKGIVHNCILWNEVLGPSSCNQLVMWPHEDFEFTVVGFGRNKTASGESTKLDFLAAQSVWAKLPGYSGNESSQTGFFDSYIYNWLSTRFLNSLPLTWRSILADTSVHTIVNDGTLRKETSKTAKIWLPAQNELFKSSDITEPWKSEASTMPLFTLGGGIDYNRAFAPGCPTKDVCPSLTSSCKWFYDSTEEPIDAPQGAIWKNNNRVYVKYFGFWMKLGWSLNSNDRPQSYYYYCRSSGSAKGTFKTWWSNEECQTYVATADNSGVNYIVPCFSI